MTSIDRRQLLTGLGAGVGLVALTGVTGGPAAYGAGPGPEPEHPGARGGSSRSRGGVEVEFSPAGTVLRDARPAAVELVAAPIDEAIAGVRASIPALMPSAVALHGHRGAVVSRDASGDAVAWADATTMLPEADRVPATVGTVYDLASVSKLFTSITVVQLIERGLVALEETVATYLPEFAAAGKETVTIRQLLTHTSGFVAFLPLWSDYPDPASRIRAVMDQPLDHPAGTVYTYSDLNLITLGVLVERLTGRTLDRIVRDRITGPLGMTHTGYNPKDPSVTAATEYQTAPPRGMVRGSVHDENAWSLGGVAGHAGVFSTVDDLAILCQALLNGGTYRGQRILRETSVRSMVTDFNTAFPGDAHGLGFELDQRWYMQGMSGPVTAGHTGYTGTSLVIDFSTQSFAILLTNRVHPSRDTPSTNPPRRTWAQGMALAQPVHPVAGRTAWFTGITDATTATLTASLRAPTPAGARLSFSTWLDQEETDPLTLETSRDGTTWTLLPFDLRDRGTVTHTTGTVALSGIRRWTEARADLPSGTRMVRWTSVTDPSYLGRGVYVDAVRVAGRGGVLFDGESDGRFFTAVGWERATR